MFLIYFVFNTFLNFILFINTLINEIKIKIFFFILEPF